MAIVAIAAMLFAFLWPAPHPAPPTIEYVTEVQKTVVIDGGFPPPMPDRNPKR